MEHLSIVKSYTYNTYNIIQIYYVCKNSKGQTKKHIYHSFELSISEEKTKCFMTLTPNMVKIFKFLPLSNKFFKPFFSFIYNQYYKTFFHITEALPQLATGVCPYQACSTKSKKFKWARPEAYHGGELC